MKPAILILALLLSGCCIHVVQPEVANHEAPFDLTVPEERQLKTSE